MDESVKKKLWGKTAFSPNVNVEYVPEAYRDEEIPDEYKLTVYLQSLTNKEKQQLRRQNADEEQYDEKLRELVRKKIKDVKNFWDLGTEQKVDCQWDENNFLKREYVDMMPDEIVGEIALQLMNMSGLGKLDSEQLSS